MSIFQQHSHPLSKDCSIMILPPGLKLGCLWRKIGAAPIRYRINLSTKQLLKRGKLTFRILQWQVLEATTQLKQHLALCFTIFRPSTAARHVLNASRHCLPIQLVCIPTVSLSTSPHLLTFSCIDFRPIFCLRGTSLVATASNVQYTTWNRLLANHLLDKQG